MEYPGRGLSGGYLALGIKVEMVIPASNEPKSSSLDLGDCREGQRPRSSLTGL